MDPNIDFDALWDQMTDEFFEENPADEVIRLIRERQHVGNNTRPRQRRRVINRGREEGHTRLFNDYFSENPIYTDDQFRRRFRMRRHVFLRIVEALGNHDEYFQTRVDAVRYHRLNGRIQKFVGCYKAAVSQNKSGRSESDIMIEAHKIYEQDEKRKFLEEHAWRLLKDEPKWKGDVIENCSKRTKVSNSGGYTTSSNPGTPIDCSDYDQATPASRPMGQKMAKRKSKGKSVATPFDVDLTVMESTLSERIVVMLRVTEVREKEANARELEAKAREAEAKAKEEETEAKWYDILFKDT
jgi:hypothetical protein